jgi:putative nucleotidyltransferase-like protein
MKWSGRANKQVVEAVVAAFREPAEKSAVRLSRLTVRDWHRSYHWLDASGMALYFLDRVESLHIENALPAAALERLRGNLADNRQRSSAMLVEFASLNQSFQRAGLAYVNLKGFSLSPESCPRPELRCQQDFDFLLDGTQLDLCRRILSKTGYELMAATPDVWEFKAGSDELTSIADHYKWRPQRSVEVHFATSGPPTHLPFRDARLERRIRHSWGGITFPALAPADQFIAQAMHIFKHLCSACTRLSWLLEYQHHIALRYQDQSFWEDVRKHASGNPQTSTAIGLATLLSYHIFGGEPPAQLAEWSSAHLPAPVKLWAEHYGREAVLADFPGTKLYLLLQEELKGNDGSWKHTKRNRLMPLRPAPRIVSVSSNDDVWKRLRNELFQLRYLLFRLRFHVVEGLHYLVEVSRWKRRLAALPNYRPNLIVD